MQSKLRTNPDDLWKREYNELREQFLREQQEKAYSGRDAYASSQPGKATGHQTTLASIKEAILKAQSQSQLNKQNLQNHDLSWTQKVRTLCFPPCEGAGLSAWLQARLFLETQKDFRFGLRACVLVPARSAQLIMYSHATLF